MKRPFAWFVFNFCLGIFAASRLNFVFVPALLLACGFLLLSFLLIKRDFVSGVFLLCLAFLSGAILLKSSSVLPAGHILKLTSNKIASLRSFAAQNKRGGQAPFFEARDGKDNYFIKGVVDQCPIARDDRVSFLFKTSQAQFAKQAYKCCGSILVCLRGCQPVLYGEELILRGALAQPYWAKEPVFYAGPPGIIRKTGRNRGFFLKRFAFKLKGRIKEIITRRLSPLSASILSAMMLGERTQVPQFLSSLMRKTGTIHILVVSGFHVGIVFFVTVLFLRLFRFERRARLYLAIPCLVIYCFGAGASLAVTRAAIMAVTLIIARLLRREIDIYNSIALAVMLILTANPRQLFNIGFQLSFASVISIVYLYPRIKAFLRIGFIKISFLRMLVESCIVSFSACLGTAGIIAYYFRIFSPIAIPANVFIVPLAALITLSGFSMVFFSLIAPPLAPFFAYTVELMAIFLVKISGFLLQFPYACLSFGG